MDFLAGHNFDVGALFNQGIRYLSRAEENLVREEAVRRWAPNTSMKDIEGRMRDEANVRFLQAVRLEINAWTASGKVCSCPSPLLMHGLKSGTSDNGKVTHIILEHPSFFRNGRALAARLAQRPG